MLELLSTKSAIARACAFAVAIILSGHCVNAQENQEQAATCIAEGRTYMPGDIACIPACYGQQRLARCEQTDGGVDWTSLSDNCPNAMAPAFPESPRQDARLALGPMSLKLPGGIEPE